LIGQIGVRVTQEKGRHHRKEYAEAERGGVPAAPQDVQAEQHQEQQRQQAQVGCVARAALGGPHHDHAHGPAGDGAVGGYHHRIGLPRNHQAKALVARELPRVDRVARAGHQERARVRLGHRREPETLLVQAPGGGQRKKSRRDDGQDQGESISQAVQCS